MSYKITMEKMINGVRSTVYPKTIVSQVKGIERFIRKFIPADSKVPISSLQKMMTLTLWIG